jgi:hypothetical protein
MFHPATIELPTTSTRKAIRMRTRKRRCWGSPQTIPVQRGKLGLGTWQAKPSNRKLVVTVMG